MEMAMPSVEHTPTKHSNPLGRMASIAIVSLVSCLVLIDALTHSQPLILPLTSAALTIIGFTWAAILTLRHSRHENPLSDRLTWPSLMLFLGFAAAMLSDADRLVQYLQIR
jgi:hypothetical protein